MNNQVFTKKNWEMVTFGEVSQEVRETEKEPIKNGIDEYVGLEHIESNDLHIYSRGVVAEGTTFTRKFTKGQLLFGKRRAYLRKAAVADFDGICSSDILVLKANQKKVLSEFFPFIVTNDRFFDFAVDESAGSLSPRVKYKDLAKFEFLLPPLEEQKKLADLLWAVDRLLQAYKELEKNIRVYFLSQLKRYTSTKDKNKSEICKLSEVVEILDNKRKPLNSQQRGVMQGEFPYFGANGIVDKISQYIFDEELVLVAEDGGNYFDYLDKPIAYKISGKSWVNNHAHVLKVKKNKIIHDWLYYSLVHRNLREHIVGTTRYKLNKSGLCNVTIYVPSIDKQHEFVRNLNLVADMELTKKIENFQKVYKSLINQIF